MVKNEMETAIIGAMMQQTDNYSLRKLQTRDFTTGKGKFPLLPQDIKLISK